MGANGLAVVLPGLPKDWLSWGLFPACCFLSSVAAIALSTPWAILVGQVGSRGECRRTRGVVEKRVGRLTAGSEIFILLAHAVQFAVALPLREQVSAWLVPAQYGHITCVLQNFNVWPYWRQFMHQVLVTCPCSVFLV